MTSAPTPQWMDSHGVPRDYLQTVLAEHTGQAFITTDLDNNQITAFHPGAMGQSHLNTVADADNVSIGIVAPDGRDGMIQHATAVRGSQHPLHLRSGPGPADVRWRRPADFHRPGELGDGQ